MDKTMLIDAIVGAGHPCNADVSVGLAKVVGNQWNDAIVWDREALASRLEVTNLINLYLQIRETRGDPIAVVSQS